MNRNMPVPRPGGRLLLFQLLLLPVSILLFTTLFFFVPLPVSVWHAPLALLVTLGISYVSIKPLRLLHPSMERSRPVFLTTTLVFLSILFLSGFAASSLPDFSQDGQAYHQPAVIALARGWNPVRHTLLEQHNPFYPTVMKGNQMYVNHYPKASWITAAVVFKLTGSLESGKLFHFLYLLAVCLSAWFFLSRFRRMSYSVKILITVITACNPVALYQYTSYYNDGQLASLTAVAFIFAMEYILTRTRRPLVFLSLSLFTLANIKFTGLIYGCIIGGLAWLAVLILHRDWQRRFIVSISITVLVAVLVVGFQPYVSNTLQKNHPFYPAVGAAYGKKSPVQNVLWRQVPESFIIKNRFSKLFYSVFSVSDHRLHQMPRLKIPLTVQPSESTTFRYGDARYGGFGPLFGGALALLLIAAGVLLLKKRWRELRALKYTFIAAIILLAATLINPECWWARLAPQLWLLGPVLLVSCFFQVKKGEKKRVPAYLGGLAMLVLLVNVCWVLTVHMGHGFQMNRRFNKQMQRLGDALKRENAVLMVYPDVFYLSLQNRLHRHKIPFKPVKELPPGIESGHIIGTPNARYWIKR